MIKTILTISLIFSAVAFAVDHFKLVDKVTEQKQDFADSAHCIKMLIATGEIERREIGTFWEGGCYIKN